VAASTRSREASPSPVVFLTAPPATCAYQQGCERVDDCRVAGRSDLRAAPAARGNVARRLFLAWCMAVLFVDSHGKNSGLARLPASSAIRQAALSAERRSLTTDPEAGFEPARLSGARKLEPGVQRLVRIRHRIYENRYEVSEA
jgi:hypothetical protein